MKIHGHGFTIASFLLKRGDTAISPSVRVHLVHHDGLDHVSDK